MSFGPSHLHWTVLKGSYTSFRGFPAKMGRQDVR